ncbi:unnamed protein product, partial [Mesorhabditis spiculigera]
MAATLEKLHHELPLQDPKKCDQEALDILKTLKPEWKREDVKFEVFTAGITNKIFAASVSDDDKVIFRVFGKNTEKIIDRRHELESWAVLAEKGLAAPLLGLFKNGIVCGYLPGKTLDVKLVRKPEMQTKIAEAMAKMHNIETGHAKLPCVYDKMRNFLSNIGTFEDEAKQAQYDRAFHNVDLETRVAEMEAITSRLQPEVGFCHNDLLVYNILYDEKNEKLSFIDYEYADFNFTSFDTGNHFCEWAGVDNPDFTLCPSKEVRRGWLKHYLKSKNGTEPSEHQLETAVQQSDLFMAMSHLFWTIWAIVQAQNSTIEFDYLGYAIQRLKVGQECMEEYLKSTR